MKAGIIGGKCITFIIVSLSVCIEKVVVVKVSVCMFVCNSSVRRERVKHTKRLHLQLTVYSYITMDYILF